MNDELRKTILEFVDDFEVTFDTDWDYTKEMLGIREDKEHAKEIRENPDDVIFYIHPDGTFINPNVEDEIADWGNRSNLLTTYRKLKQLLAET